VKRFVLPLFILLASLVFLAPSCPGEGEKVRIVAYGDSLTYGWWILSSYPAILEEMMELPRGTILNAGLPGEMVANSAPRLRELLDCGEYPNVRAFLFWEGGNDILVEIMTNNPDLSHPVDPSNPAFDAIEASLRGLVEMILDEGYEVVLGTYYYFVPYKIPCYIIPAGMTQEQADNLATYVALGNETILGIAADYGLRVARMDELGFLGNNPYNYFDCIHANPKGHELIAAKWYEVTHDLDLGLDDDASGDGDESDESDDYAGDEGCGCSFTDGRGP